MAQCPVMAACRSLWSPKPKRSCWSEILHDHAGRTGRAKPERRPRSDVRFHLERSSNEPRSGLRAAPGRSPGSTSQSKLPELMLPKVDRSGAPCKADAGPIRSGSGGNPGLLGAAPGPLRSGSGADPGPIRSQSEPIWARSRADSGPMRCHVFLRARAVLEIYCMCSAVYPLHAPAATCEHATSCLGQCR